MVINDADLARRDDGVLGDDLAGERFNTCNRRLSTMSSTLIPISRFGTE